VSLRRLKQMVRVTFGDCSYSQSYQIALAGVLFLFVVVLSALASPCWLALSPKAYRASSSGEERRKTSQWLLLGTQEFGLALYKIAALAQE
jgi:hypothetical protein